MDIEGAAGEFDSESDIEITQSGPRLEARFLF